MGGKYVNGVDIIRVDDSGLIVEFRGDGPPAAGRQHRAPTDGRRARCHRGTVAMSRALRLDVYTGRQRELDNGGSFSPTTSTLITGPTESVLVDTQYMADDVDAVIGRVLATGTTLPADDFGSCPHCLLSIYHDCTETTYYILNQLRPLYGDSEASQVTDWIMEHITGSKKTERMLYKNEPLSAEEETMAKQYTGRLLQQEPVQYVLNESWFCGLRFYVDNNVLIPRPETEELVEWVITNCKFPVDELKILDIGTGSGCIAIALKRRIRRAEVWACDTSIAALDVAKRNADSLGTPINFLELDFLDKKKRELLPAFDIVISNPPYIPVSDKKTMKPNVLEHEPFTALFVPDNDPLIFYKAIAGFGIKHLNETGSIFTEIHEDMGKDTSSVFQEAGYATEIKRICSKKTG